MKRAQTADLDKEASARADRLAELLAATPGQEQHGACGVTARPCHDCRRTAVLDCIDRETCGQTDLCRPCSASWRLKMWRSSHTRHIRDFHRAVERYPELANLHPDQGTAAAVWVELRRAVWHEIKRRKQTILSFFLPRKVGTDMAETANDV